jgi:hypothetical protein
MSGRKLGIALALAVLVAAALGFVAGRGARDVYSPRQGFSPHAPGPVPERPMEEAVREDQARTIALLREENERLKTDLARALEELAGPTPEQRIESRREQLLDGVSATLPPGLEIEQVVAELDWSTYRRYAASLDLDEVAHQAVVSGWVRRQVARDLPNLTPYETEEIVSIAREVWDRIRTWQRETYMPRVRDARSMEELNELYGERHRRIVDTASDIARKAANRLSADKPDRAQFFSRLHMALVS